MAASARAAGARSRPAAFEYDPYEPHELVLRAEWIPIGTIQEVRKATFVIAVDEWIVGPEDPPATLEIWRFEDWTCAGRWASYEVGQRALFHLREPDPPETKHPFAEWPHARVLGAGNEGECPFLDVDGAKQQELLHRAFPSSFRYGDQNVRVGPRRSRVEIAGRKLFGTWIVSDLYAEAVTGLRRTFRWEGGWDDGYVRGARAARWQERIVPLVDYDGIQAYAKTSWLALSLARWVVNDDAYRPHPSEPGRPR